MNVNAISNELKVYAVQPVQKVEAVEKIVAPEKVQKTDNANVGNETKKQYLELAVGVKEKELKRLGLTDEEDGVVTMKKEMDELTPWEQLKQEELEKEEADKIEAEKIEKEEEKKEEEEENKECETCAKRKYLDGSDEMVSFKSAAHIAPEAAASRVRAHEQEHVTNAYEKAEAKNGEVQMASVAIHTSICPECGRTYVSGGTTTTTIKYNNDDYASNARKQDATVVPGNKVDEMM